MVYRLNAAQAGKEFGVIDFAVEFSICEVFLVLKWSRSWSCMIGIILLGVGEAV